MYILRVCKKYGRYLLDCLHYLLHRLIMSLFIYAISVELNATKWICKKKSNLFHCKVPGITSYILRNVVPQGKLSSLALKLQARLHKKVTYFTKQDLPAFFFFFFSLPTLLTIEYSSFASLFIFNDEMVSFDFKFNIEYMPRVSRKHTKIGGLDSMQIMLLPKRDHIWMALCCFQSSAHGYHVTHDECSHAFAYVLTCFYFITMTSSEGLQGVSWNKSLLRCQKPSNVIAMAL